MNGGPSGFNNAPITRAFVISCAIFTIVFGIQGRSNKLGFSYQDIFKKLQLWKLVVSVFAFASTPELMFGSYLLYYFRVFERQIGSNKHSVFILFSLVMSSLLEVLVLALLNDPSLNLLASGPYGLIFSAFVPFFLDIPVSTRFRVFSLHFPDKSFIYLAGIQLLLSSWKRSIIPGICGILAGTLYRLNIFCIRRMKVLSRPSFSFEKSDLLKINRNRWQNSDKPAKNPYHMTKGYSLLNPKPFQEGIRTLLPNTDAGQFLENNNNYKTMEKNSDETPHLTTPSIFYSGDALHTTTPRVSQPPKRGKSS